MVFGHKRFGQLRSCWFFFRSFWPATILFYVYRKHDLRIVYRTWLGDRFVLVIFHGNSMVWTRATSHTRRLRRWRRVRRTTRSWWKGIAVRFTGKKTLHKNKLGKKPKQNKVEYKNIQVFFDWIAWYGGRVCTDECVEENWEMGKNNERRALFLRCSPVHAMLIATMINYNHKCAFV